MKVVSGVKIEEVLEGTGASAERGDVVSIEWRGWLNRGDAFGAGSQTVHISRRIVIAGLEYGLVGMREGGIRKLRISPQLGYRDQAVPGIPANAVLNFEVKLVSVEKKQSIEGTE